MPVLEEVLSTREQVEDIFDRINLKLNEKESYIELIDVDENGIVRIKANGICSECPMSIMMLQFLILKLLKKKIPIITNVIAV